MMKQIDIPLNIKVVGTGSGGNIAVNYMVETDMKGIEFINLDISEDLLNLSRARQKLHLKTRNGISERESRFEVNKAIAEESRQEIVKVLEGADVVFIIAAMGGSVGSAAAPVVAEAAREAGALSIGIVTRPLTLDMPDRLQRYATGEERINRLLDTLNTLIIVSNDKLQNRMEDANAAEAFRVVDEMFAQGVRVITDILIRTCLRENDYSEFDRWQGVKFFVCNCTFTEITSMLREGGPAYLGVGHASGKKGFREAARMAAEGLLSEISIERPASLLLNITRGSEFSFYDINELQRSIGAVAGKDVNLFFSDAVLEEDMGGKVKVTAIANQLKEG